MCEDARENMEYVCEIYEVANEAPKCIMQHLSAKRLKSRISLVKMCKEH